MPGNVQALFLLLLFIVPGFVFVEVDARRRPAQKLPAFDKTVISVLFSAILHAILLWPILVCLWLFGFELGKLLNPAWLMEWVAAHLLLTYSLLLFYFLLDFCKLRLTPAWRRHGRSFAISR